MGKYGKKNEVKLDPLSYNIGLIGESGIGKTTVIKEMCEKLVGEDGYMFLECGHEDGGDAINGIMSENCPDWDKFEDVVDDIIENKVSDYPQLRVVIIDTIDQLFSIAEPEVVRLHNNENPDKRTTSIKAAFGGFQGGEQKAIQIVQDKLWELKTVGVSFIMVGHTKKRDVEDVVTGQTYSTLTTNMLSTYFNAMKTKLHFLGVASIDREIVKQKTGKKNVVTKKDEEKGKVLSETRKITFRDDNYSIDSKSRFSDIIDSIPLDADELIKALTDAIKAEQSKSGKTYEDTQKEQEQAEATRLKEIAETEKKTKADKELKEVISQITDFIKANKSDMSKIKPILEKCKELGYANPTTITDVKDAKTVLSLI